MNTSPEARMSPDNDVGDECAGRPTRSSLGKLGEVGPVYPAGSPATNMNVISEAVDAGVLASRSMPRNPSNYSLTRTGASVSKIRKVEKNQSGRLVELELKLEAIDQKLNSILSKLDRSGSYRRIKFPSDKDFESAVELFWSDSDLRIVKHKVSYGNIVIVNNFELYKKSLVRNNINFEVI